MRGLIRTLILSALLALPVQAQTDEPRDWEAVMDAIAVALEAGGMEGNDAAFLVINRALRIGRAEGRLTPDWAIFFAMAADHMRNNRDNPAYALSLTEEGLVLLAGHPEFPEHDGYSAALRVSGAYALADLGRMDEAVANARLAMPAYRGAFGDDNADELEGFVALWAEGKLGDLNTSALDLAIQTFERAQVAADEGAFGRALSLASAALLPEDGALDPGAVRAQNARAELLIAGSLRALGRTNDAANGYLRAINRLARTPWDPDAAPDWWPEADAPGGTALLYGAFQSLAGLAISGGATDLAIAALAAAETFARSAENRIDLLIYQAVLASRDGDHDRALTIIARSRDRALAAGETYTAVMADFYAAQVATLAARRAGTEPDPALLIATAEAALAVVRDGVDTTTILSDAARFLTRTADHGAALDYARRSLARQRAAAEDAATRDSAFGGDQARAARRGALETFLRAANNAAVASDPGCPDPSRDAWYSCVVTSRGTGLR